MSSGPTVSSCVVGHCPVAQLYGTENMEAIRYLHRLELLGAVRHMEVGGLSGPPILADEGGLFSDGNL